MIKSNFITSVFQKYLINKDIRNFKSKTTYYFIFRVIRKFLAKDIIVNIYNFKISGSINKNKTSYFLLKKCEFGDQHELSTIKKFSRKNKIFLIDCGCNYGFYSFYTASLSKKNLVFSVEASKKTSKEFLKNFKLNNFQNIKFKNNAISSIDNNNISFNESENDWESSQTHSKFDNYAVTKISTLKIDTLVKNVYLGDYLTMLKLDIEGNEMNALKGATEFVKNSSPFIIIEISKYIFENKINIEYLKNFLQNFNYSIYSIYKKKQKIEEIMNKLNNLKDKYKTIGNYYLIKNSSKTLEDFISNE